MTPGQQQFRRAITEFRNRYIVAGLAPLFVFREEIVTNDEFSDRGGTDDPTQNHFMQLLLNCDRWRRRVTHNPDNGDLGDKIEKAIAAGEALDSGANPFGGDDIQNASGGLIDLPWRLDGSDPDIPLNPALKFKNGAGLLLLGAVDTAIVNWTRLNSRDRTQFITRFDSMRIYGDYQAIHGYIKSFMGDKNRIDIAQVLASDEPLGPTDSPNRVGESANATATK